MLVQRKMRRFGQRWRDAATPPEVLDLFKVEGRYEVLTRNSNGSEEWVDGLDIDPAGFRFPSFELDRWQARDYRRRNTHRRVTWASLPMDVQATVREWIKED